MIDETYIRRITKLAKRMRDFGTDSLVDDDLLALEAFEFIISWWKSRKFEEKDGKKYIKQ